MFPLKHRELSGYRWGQTTWYKTRHLGVDYRANYDELKAPFKGTVKKTWGPQGGNQIYFTPASKDKHGDVVMRFMHLKKILKEGKVKKGEVIAITGNTGALTKAPHLHLDISKKSVQIYNFNNFIDPEKYNWA